MINDEAVEAASKKAFWTDDHGGHIPGKWTWETIPEKGREDYRKMVRAALTAAAPYIAAQAWDEGIESGVDGSVPECDYARNPYRKEVGE